MKLDEDWKLILRHAWSMRLILISIALDALAAALSFGDALPISPGHLFMLTLAVNIAAGIARLIPQKTISRSTR